MPTTIPSTADEIKVFKAKRRVERNEPDQVNKVVCLECPWEYTSKPGQRPEIAVVHGKEHHRTSEHRLELHCVIEVFVETIPSGEARRGEAS